MKSCFVESIKKAILCLLSFFMCINMIITEGLAKTIDYIICNNVEVAPVYEIESERDQYSKSIRLNNGKKEVCYYEYETNEFDEESDKWIEIDNTIKENGQFYENSNNKNWSVKIDKNGFIEIKDSDVLFSYEFVSNKGHEVYIEKNKNDYDNWYRNKSVSEQKVVFSSENYDVEYSLFGRNIKENFILKNREAGNEFVYSLKVKECEVKVTDNTIAIYKEGKAVYTIEAPVAVDSKGNTTNKLYYELTEENMLKLTVDKDWLERDETVFPVTVDPVIKKVIDSSFLDVMSIASNNRINYGLLVCSNGVGGQADRKGVIRFPVGSLDNGEIVTKATLGLYVNNVNCVEDFYVRISPLTEDVLTEDYNYSALCSNTGNSIDYIKINQSIRNTYVDFDITEYVNEYYTCGNNNGLVIENVDGYSGYCSFNSLLVANSLPYFQITVMSTKGLDDNYSFETVDTLSMGQFNVSDYTGSLTYLWDDLTSGGEYFPVNVYHVFNSAERSEYSSFGKGLRLNVSLSVEHIINNENSIERYRDYYVFTDEDGTEYTYIQSEDNQNVYEREFDTSYKLEVTDSGIELKNNGLTYYFNSLGLVVQAYDADTDRRQIYTYDRRNLVSVTDGSGNTVTLTYGNHGLLESLSTEDKIITYHYDDNDRLITINKADGNTISLTYDNSGNIIEAANSNEGSIELQYYSNGKVADLLVVGRNGGAGKSLSFDYTLFSTSVEDEDGYTVAYQFDNEGHVVSSGDEYGRGYYGKYSNSIDNNKHSLVYSSDMQYRINNLLKNHSLKNTDYWNIAGDVSLNDGVFALSSGSSVGQDVSCNLNEGEIYTLSCLAKGDSIILSINGESELFTLADEYKPVSYTFVAQSDLSSIACSISSLSDNTCVKNVILEKGSTASLYSLVENDSFLYGNYGWETTNLTSNDSVTDNVYVVHGNVAQPKMISQIINISGNPSDRFTISLKGRRDTVVLKDDRHAGVKIEFLNNDTVINTEYVDLSACDRDNYQYVYDEICSEGNFDSLRLSLICQNLDGEVYFESVNLFHKGYGDHYQYDNEGDLISYTDENGHTTQYSYTDITVNNETEKAISSVNYIINNVTVVSEQYSYNTCGNITSIVTTDYRYDVNDERRVSTVEYSYDDNGNLIEEESDDIPSGMLGYTGDRITSYTDVLGNTVHLSYDNSGRINSITDGNSNTVSYQYGSNELISVISSSDSVIRYYHNNLGLIEYVYVGEGDDRVTYHFVYDEFNNLSGVYVGNNQLVGYEYYRNGNIKKVVYPNENIRMNTIVNEDTEPGNPIDPVVPPIEMYSSLLNTPREKTITYEYDELNRVAAVKYDENAKYRYYYGSNGNIGLFDDLNENVRTRYIYDIDGKPVSEIRSDGTRIDNEYNQSGNIVSSELNQIISNHKTEYEYNSDNELDKIVYNNESVLDIDNSSNELFERKEYKVNNNTILESQTGYIEDNNGNSSGVVESYSNSYGSNTERYIYSYDGNGNIVQVVYQINNTDYHINYSYNSLNELIREDNEYTGKSIEYDYDSRGNITEQRYYLYALNSNFTGNNAYHIKEYEYSSGDWKDVLTEYRERNTAGIIGESHTVTHEIEYNTSGAPLTYIDDAQLEWDYGKLVGYSKGNSEVQYNYNVDGIRTSKVVDGEETVYTLSGSKILKEKSAGKVIIYEYDENNNPVSFVYNGNRYYYISDGYKNITGIIDSAGNKVASYLYDGYGNVEIVNHTSLNIGDINPLRYRGYYFDNETGLYYLNSRYYDSNTGRFISADDVDYLGASGSVLSYNLFAYCENNPVNNVDEDGNWLDRVVCGTILSAAFTILGNIVCRIFSIKGSTKTKIVAGCVAIGAVLGAILGPIVLSKCAPLLKNAISSLETKRFSIRMLGPSSGGNIFGVVISNTIIIMLHYPHPKYNEWFFHLQIQVKIGRVQKNIAKIILYRVDPTKWRK